MPRVRLPLRLPLRAHQSPSLPGDRAISSLIRKVCCLPESTAALLTVMVSILYLPPAALIYGH